ncbi:MAG: molybdopterin-guanine dinucleotide biosynthesis protein B [Epsilonproteobacteria bacterium]|nr:molybdopterin-guanine dinucleotide biosynthesis protein B [Campylobacterota bacterium]
MKKIAVAFTGPSNSGKTTLIEKIAKILIMKHQIAIIKNDPKDKAHFDIEGKDSYKFSATGAETVVVSPTRTTYFSKQSRSLKEIIDMLGPFEILLVEGLKTLPLPRIAIFRQKIDESYFPHSDAIAIDESVDIQQYNIPSHIDILDLNDPSTIIGWIKTHAKDIKDIT